MCQCEQRTYFALPNPRKRARGLGQTGTQIGIAAGGAATGLIAGALIGGPIGAAVGGAISITATAVSSLFTPDYYKIYASNDANETANLLQENLNGWNNLPQSSRVPAVQQYFINNYLTLWNALVSYCSNPSLGTAGQKCISDRSPNGPYPWDQYYLDPIQNSPVVPQLTAVTFTDPLTGVKVTVQPSTSTSILSTASNEVSNALGFQLTTEDWLGLAAGLILIAIL